MLKGRRRVLVVGNYPADQQQSMFRFAELLVRIYQPQAQVDLIYPPVVVSRLPCVSPLVRKYLAYVDKLLLFPFFLLFRAIRADLVHIADHGNAYYSFFCNPKKCIVTCHDLFMMRAVRGDATLACHPSAIGFLLQRLIMAGLRRAAALAFVSHVTYDDFKSLGGGRIDQRYAVIPNQFNAPFTSDLATFALSELERGQLPLGPYLLMVGSADPRKNRALALRVLERLGPCSSYRLVFAGDPLTAFEQLFRDTHLLGDRLVSIVRPSHSLLNHLYCQAHALLFPSLAEGFGWPLVEAQACGCPVIASNTTAIPEVAGPAALFADPQDVDAFVSHVRSLEVPVLRSRMIRLGYQNKGRFTPEVLSDAYWRFVFQP